MVVNDVMVEERHTLFAQESFFEMLPRPYFRRFARIRDFQVEFYPDNPTRPKAPAARSEKKSWIIYLFEIMRILDEFPIWEGLQSSKPP
jgi:hypothetical protein